MITSNEHTIADPVPLKVSFSTCPQYLYPCNIVYKLYYENLHSYQIFYVIKTEFFIRPFNDIGNTILENQTLHILMCIY